MEYWPIRAASQYLRQTAGCGVECGGPASCELPTRDHPAVTRVMNQAYPTVPTVQEVLDQRYESNGLYRWDVEGGAVWLPEAVLRPALEAAYEEGFPEWQQSVEIEGLDDEDECPLEGADEDDY